MRQMSIDGRRAFAEDGAISTQHLMNVRFVPLVGVDMPPPTNPDRILGLAMKAGAWDRVQGAVTKAAG